MSDDTGKPVIFLLHALGGSARSFDVVIPLLPAFDCVAIDLPGFGDAADASALGVEQVAASVIDRIKGRAPKRWMLVGHSMGGKIATILAARAEGGAIGLSGLAGVVLLAASPPEPEPMDEDRRQMMIGWASAGSVSHDNAQAFVTMNQAGDMASEAERSAVTDVTRASRHGWLGWLERGSREDWSANVGVLDTPALIVAGSEDGEDLGAEAQRRLNAPHYANATLEVVQQSGHLLPLEQPATIATLIEEHWQRVCGRDASIPAPYAELIASDRVSERTRCVLIGRATADEEGSEPRALSARQMAVLRVLLDHVLPQDERRIDLAARIDTGLAEGPGDGWRFAALPADKEAYRLGLNTLDMTAGGKFAEGLADEQTALIDAVANGQGGIDGEGRYLSHEQMKLWFQDVCADAVRTWLSHPANMAWIGYDGFANGGDGVRKQGYQRTHADDPEGWEPARARASA